jgi:hypothetical protein
LEEVPGTDRPWAAPLWFVQGFLSMTGELHSTELVKIETPPSEGLERTTIEVPAGMKVKLWKSGIELTDRKVRAFVIEHDEDAYAVRMEGLLRQASPNWPPPGFPRPPHIQELDSDFAVGNLRGVRLTTRHNESSLIVMRNYLGRVGKVPLEVSLIAKKPTGDELETYEKFLRTLQEKRIAER